MVIIVQKMIDEFKGKRIVILGLGRQGKAIARFASHAGAQVIASDLRSEDELKVELTDLVGYPIEFVFGHHPLVLLEDTDMLIVSGGVSLELPIVKEANRLGIAITNDSLEFMKRTPAKVIGITGSAGKTTTTALTGAMVEQGGIRAWVGGNIGRPLIDDLTKMEADDIVVQELSSFQLELWSRSPQVAAILNITPNHLDRHKTMAAYSAAKSNILRYQAIEDVAVISADDPGALALQEAVRGRLRQFSLELMVEDGAYIRQGKIWLADGDQAWAVCDLDDIPLRGWHNVSNVLASATLANSVGTPIEAINQAIKSFTPVEHRMELVAVINDVQYINDSIATAPERAMAALDSFAEPLILLAGGRDKAMVWDEWAERALTTTKAIMLFGDLAGHLERVLLGTEVTHHVRPTISRFNDMREAVFAASTMAVPGDVILLAPGGTSFDAYVDFAARGEAFRQLVQQIEMQQATRRGALSE